ncbi:hypothetical protein KX262_02700 [Escherichia coli]|nr:hypothetical protein [Escherichia coli]
MITLSNTFMHLSVKGSTEAKWSSGCSSEQRNHEGELHETCCDAGALAVCKMPALVLWSRALSLVLATFP